MTGAVAVYRHYAADGRLLYVGYSRSPVARMDQHLSSSSWITEVTRIEIEWHADRASARQAERKAIRDERPIHNKQDLPRVTAIPSQSQFVTEIEDAARDHGLSISEILRGAGVQQSTWWRWKSGKFSPQEAKRAAVMQSLKALSGGSA